LRANGTEKSKNRKDLGKNPCPGVAGEKRTGAAACLGLGEDRRAEKL